MAEAQQDSKEIPSPPPPSAPEMVSLKICLRLEDGSPFTSLASLHVTADQGSEIPGNTTKSEGETIFPELRPGDYVVEASAPGFVTLTQNVEIGPGQSLVTLFLVMEPEPASGAAETLLHLVSNDPNPNESPWILPGAAVPQVSEESLFPQPFSIARPASLKICLRLEDGSPFTGLAIVRVVSSQGPEVNANRIESESELSFPSILPGPYVAEASAPGFMTMKENVEIESGQRLKTLFLVMKPEAARYIPPETQPSLRPDDPNPKQFSWIGPKAADSMPKVAPDVPCSLPLVLQGAGRRMGQFVNNLDKFSALEHVEHFQVNKKGKRGLHPDSRSFEYLVSVSRNSAGLFQLEEYRNGSLDASQFPEGIATEGLPAMALIFHPLLASDFNFSCEGLGEWGGRPAWQVYFEQRKDRPIRIREYVMDQQPYPIPLKGRAWIDSGTYQVLRLESDLISPIKKIRLTEEHLSIEYAPVQFRADNLQLWLPKIADIYVEQNKHRYYRSHTYSNFHVFAVDTDQRIQPPQDSYCFTNTSDRDISGILTVNAASAGTFHLEPVSFTISAGSRICKFVGPGRDVNVPAESIGSATFVNDGPEGSVKVDASFAKATTLDIVSDSPVSVTHYQGTEREGPAPENPHRAGLPLALP
ncbi:MAG: carboxypeptidase-like regulatory domain-containing protein [Candidatus Acidiferrales bacterium]